MKKNHIYAAMLCLAFAGGLVSCSKFDDGELWNKVNELDGRVTAIEKELSQMNTDINSLSVIVNALENNVCVNSVKAIEGGYIISFSDGQKVTITNGQDGADGLTPYVGTNGNWWIGTSDTGMRAVGYDGTDGKNGQDGVNGQTPYIGNNGNWWIGNTDSGVKAVGQDGADGKDGSNGKDGTNGKDGEDAPIISIDIYNGAYYWVQIVNGVKDWVYDSNGQKVPVTGSKAITPLMKVSMTGYWLVSYDGGLSYVEVLDEYGLPVKASGAFSGENTYEQFFTSVTFETNVLILILIDGTEVRIPIDTTGIPSDAEAQPNPEIEGEPTVDIANISAPIIEEDSNGNVMRFSLTGIQTATNEWLQLYGTNETYQNIWIEIDGKPKGFQIVNASGEIIISKSQADIIFLVDNSGSMSEEANAVAAEIISWSQTLSKTMDVQFGCVGYDVYGAISGAIDVTTVENLSSYLNRTTGTSRTVGFSGSNAATLKSKAATYAGKLNDECGAAALHFADENLNFRRGANRIYVNLTDEPNQPNNVTKFSVESVNPNSSYYIWNTAKGTIHTVYSGSTSYSWTPLYAENPILMSNYTGGEKIYAPSDFSGTTLNGLDVTGAIVNSFIIRFNLTSDLSTGLHTIRITILSADGTIRAEKIFKDVQFIF